jgi:hypothetical protein
MSRGHLGLASEDLIIIGASNANAAMLQKANQHNYSLLRKHKLSAVGIN